MENLLGQEVKVCIFRYTENVLDKHRFRKRENISKGQSQRLIYLKAKSEFEFLTTLSAG